MDCILLNKHEYVAEDGLDVAIGASKVELSKAGIVFDESGHDVDAVTDATIHFMEFTSLVD